MYERLSPEQMTMLAVADWSRRVTAEVLEA